MKNNGIEPEETEESFEKWLQWMGNDWIKSELDDLVYAKKESGELNENKLNKSIHRSIRKYLH